MSIRIMNAVVNTALPRPSAPPAPLPLTGFGTLESNPQPPVARENAPLLPDTPEVNAETEVFSLEKFVFLWLGIGHKYCEWTQ